MHCGRSLAISEDGDGWLDDGFGLSVVWATLRRSIAKIMAVTPDQPAPYAPTSAIMSLVERHRAKGLPSPVDADVLRRAGISDSLTPRTLQALVVLGLLGEDLKPTDTFEALRLAPEADFKARTVAWLDEAYADARQFVDPATDDETKVRDAFRNYRPIGQQDRMVSLFLGLYAAAGVETPKPTQPAKLSKPPQSKARTARNHPLAARSMAAQATVEQPSNFTVQSGLPPALVGLLAALPTTGRGWTKEERDRFTITFSAVLDFCYPIISGQSAQSNLEEDPDI